ncbi:hypothetical protein AB1Y20_001657 [Prymnesium parvum]|uniref:Vitamin K epoxide reductase domain-containing protein n=1 Tax=Prymnesium parvum TaxID=97485 RepID=A0AB34KCA0_PRYPA
MRFLLLCTAAAALRAPPLAPHARGSLSHTHRAPSAAMDTVRPRADLKGRAALAVLAGLGAVETSAISWSKLAGDDALRLLCPTGGGCADVLDGPWSEVFGVPLAAVGAAAYASVGLLAAAPLRLPAAGGGSKGADMLLVGLTAAMASASACLMLLLVFEIQVACALCIGSALLSASMFAVALRTEILPNRTEGFVVSVSAAALSVMAAALLYLVGPAAEDEVQFDADGLPRPPAIGSHSSEEALSIARRMKAKGGRMFGAFWCSHCINQKEIMGREAMAIVPYVECDAEGSNSQKDICVEAGVKGYPTWQLDGQLFPGEKGLDELRVVLDKLDAR